MGREAKNVSLRHNKNVNNLFDYIFIVNRRAPVRKACRYRTTGIITTGRRIIGKITISVTAIVLICWMPGIRLKIVSYFSLHSNK